MLTVGELFAGIGGIGLGLEMTGKFKVVWEVENDEYCTKILEKHWPEVLRFGDIRQCRGEVANPKILGCVDGSDSKNIGKANRERIFRREFTFTR